GRGSWPAAPPRAGRAAGRAPRRDPAPPPKKAPPPGPPAPDFFPAAALDPPAVVAGGIVQRHDHRPARDALGHAVLGEAAQFEVEAIDAPRPEALAHLAVESHLDLAVVRHPLAAVKLRDHPGLRP